MFRFDPDTDNPEKDLQNILKDYSTLACSDRDILRLLIPAQSVWRFFVDQRHATLYGKTWRNYEKKEPGYIKAMYAGYHEIFDTKQPLTVDYLQKLHHIATQNVKTKVYHSHTAPTSSGQFRSPSQGIIFGVGPGSKAGLKEMLSYLEEKENTSYLLLKERNEGQSYSLTRRAITVLREVMTQHPEWEDQQFAEHLYDQLGNVWPAHGLRPLLKKIGQTVTTDDLIDLLHEVNVNRFIEGKIHLFLSPLNLTGKQQIEQILTRFKDTPQHTPLQKLTAIAELVHALEQLHPFADGNTRVFSMLLANHLFLSAGFPIAIFYNPNRFSCSTVPEIVADFINGMKNTLQRIKTNQFQDNTASASAEQKEQSDMFQAVTLDEEKQHERSTKRLKMGM